MRVEILGCSGGIGEGLRTTSMLLGDEVLIDCGTGVGNLSVERMRKLRHIFLTHQHLDHIASLPLLADTLYETLQVQPLVVHCEPSTYETLRAHVFNWEVWPDFFRLPQGKDPVLRYLPIMPGESHRVNDLEIQAIRVNHVVPALAYYASDAHSAMSFSGDTTTNDTLWDALNAHECLDLLVVECAYPESGRELSTMARHYCPSLLAQDLGKLNHDPRICISHLKPGSEPETIDEINALLSGQVGHRLTNGEVFEI
ncbi:MAG: 3',5'-cyclic-nucleotide phosphodiesterase [Pseudomonadota bacterium]|nr:3',5'-cyclic-nucleotide phosphodiesterase [Pseudomonadota bacterium]